MFEKLFDSDNRLMRFLEKAFDLLWLNLLTMLCCIPVVTAGAAVTALHHMCLRVARNEEGNLTKGFFRAFRAQLKQATLLWLLSLVVLGILAGDYYIIAVSESGFPALIKMILWLITALIVFTAQFLFPMQARFTNPVFRTIKNAFMCSILKFPMTLAMLVVSLLPGLFFMVTDWSIPFLFLFGFSVPAYMKALLYDSFFEDLEERVRGAKEEDEPETAAENSGI